MNKLTGVMPEIKTDYDECESKSNGMRHWVVCPGGVLKEVKAEHTTGASDVLPHEDGSHNVYQKPCGSSSTNHAKMESESPLKLQERTNSGVKHYACGACGKSFVSSVSSECMKEHTQVLNLTLVIHLANCSLRPVASDGMKQYTRVLNITLVIHVVNHSLIQTDSECTKEHIQV